MRVKPTQLQALGECLAKHLPALQLESIDQHTSELLAAYSSGADFDYLIRNDKSAADDIANLRKAENHIQLAIKFLDKVGYLGNVSFDKQLSAEMKEILGISWRTSAAQSIHKLRELLQPIHQVLSDTSKLNEANSVSIINSLSITDGEIQKSRGPKTKYQNRAVTEAAAKIYLTETGKSPTLSRNNYDEHSNASGAFHDFLSDIFSAFEIDANAEHYIKQLNKT